MFQVLLGVGQQYGANLLTNGDFSSGTSGWTLPSDWTISGGFAIHTAGIGVLQGDSANVGGWDVEVTYTITDFSGTQGLYVTYGGDTGTTRAANGTYTEVLNTSSGATTINFNPVNASDTFKVSAVSARRKFY